MRRTTLLTMRAGARGGQALLVAVLLMMAILLVGILFVALVTYNQSQSARHEDALVAQAVAEGGIRYATHMLENSPDGIDWRPPAPPAMYTDGTVDDGFWGPDGVQDTEWDYYTDMEMSRGWAAIIDNSTDPGSYVRGPGFTRYPDPRNPSDVTDDEMPRIMGQGQGYFLLRVSYAPPGEGQVGTDTDWHIRIESIGRVEGTQVFRRLVAYKPLPLFNYARFVHNSTGHDRPAYLGIYPHIDMNNDGRANSAIDFLETSIDGPVKVNGRLLVAGAQGSTTFNVRHNLSPAADQYYRNDFIEATGGIARLGGHADNEPAYVDINDGEAGEPLAYSGGAEGDFTTVQVQTVDGTPEVRYASFAAETEMPTLTLGEGTTNFDRYRKLTRGTGDLVDISPDPASSEFVNNGHWGFGAGIYIDNYTDIQYDHDINALLADWQRPASATSPPTDTDSGWNALYTTYSPPAVRIEFFPDGMGGLTPVANPADVTGPDQIWWPDHPDQIWWPDPVPDRPGIRITRYDGQHWRTETGEDSGLNVRAFDYPASWLDGTDDAERHPLIVAEGNIRVSGQLPPAMIDAGAVRRIYDMVIVSGGTIYIDGQLLVPNDYLTDPVTGERLTIDDEFNTKVALLARDSVCLNATQIVPQLTSGAAPAVPNDPLNPAQSGSHWELAPGSDGSLYSTFFWGGDTISAQTALVVRQTAGSPGPSGVSLTTWVSGSGYTAYDFADHDPGTETAPGPLQDTTFVLVPPGTSFPADPPLHPDATTPPQRWGVEAVAPSWAPYRQWTGEEPPQLVLPWMLTGYLDQTVGLRNGIILRHSDPRMPGDSTPYWASRWKIAEYDGDGLPVGAISARVNAAVYAERGCWFVLTPGHFDEEVVGNAAIRDRRYNYRISFNGTIAENFTASAEAAQSWSDHLAYPAEYADGTIGSLQRWGTIEYSFDETLRIARRDLRNASPTRPAVLMPRMPLLPASPGLVYYGD